MFNLTVETAHTFYVGENGWLVHNENIPRPPYQRFNPVAAEDVNWKNLGHGFAGHGRDLGFESGREGVNGYKSLASTVISKPDEIRIGSYGNLGQDVQFYRKGDVVAVVTKDGRFITMAQSEHIPSFSNKATIMLRTGCL